MGWSLPGVTGPVLVFDWAILGSSGSLCSPSLKHQHRNFLLLLQEAPWAPSPSSPTPSLIPKAFLFS